MRDEVLPAPSQPLVGPIPDGPMAIGSDAHKRLFCALMIDRHESYEPDQVAWPVLDEAGVARLQALPIWDEALATEDAATATLKAFARREGDPLIRQAVALQAYEENRHGRLIAALCRTYGIETRPPPAPKPARHAGVAFMRLGYGECFDSFFAFGLFAYAKDSRTFPAELAAIFERVVQEEARHILFFINWARWRRQRRALPLRPFQSLRQARALARQIWLRVIHGRRAARAGGEAGAVLGDGLNLAAFLELCLYEHERRLAGYDPRLARPAAMPRLARAVLRLKGKRRSGDAKR